MKKIKVTLHKDGTQHIEALGATGEECIEFTRELEQRLGTPMGERTLKPECFEPVPEPEHVRERGQ